VESEGEFGRSRCLLFALSSLALVSLLYWRTLTQIAHICLNEDDYSHGVLLPFIGLYAVYLKRDELMRALSAEQMAKTLSSETGLRAGIQFGLLVVGLAIYLLGVASGILHLTWVSLFPVLIALVGLTSGRKVLSLLFFPIILQLMAKPLPDSVVLRLFWPLQVLAAKISSFVLELLGVPVYLVGNIIEIPQLRLMVEEACSGMRSVIALLTVSLIVGYLFNMRFLAKLILFGSSLAVAIFFNVLRVALTGILAHFYDPSAASGFFHEFSGMIVFIFGLAVVYWISSLLSGPRFTLQTKGERE